VTEYAEWRAQPPGLLWSFDDIHAEEARAVCQNALTVRAPDCPVEPDGRGGDLASEPVRSCEGDASWLTTEETRSVLGAFGLPLAAGSVAHTADEAAALAQVLGFPVAAKLAARRISHKTEVGGVRLDLKTESAVRCAFAEIMTRVRALPASDGTAGGNDAEREGVLIQSMISGGVETMIGVSDDPVFGPLVAFGLGGIHVEILHDVGFRVAPLTDRDADELLHGIRGFPLLRGYRGHQAADIDALRELLLRISRLAIEVPEIAELDLNPVIALPPGHGCRIVDARVKVRGHQA
jgi:acyl-CoA synthetase (NDP forming)